MTAEEMIDYLREKGNKYWNRGNEFDDDDLMSRGQAYLDVADELAERIG